MAGLNHNPVPLRLNCDNNIDMVTFDISRKKELGTQALSKILKFDIIFLQQLPDKNTCDVFQRQQYHHMYNDNECSYVGIIAKNRFTKLKNEVITPQLLKKRICTQILRDQNNQTIVAISWHGRTKFGPGVNGYEEKKTEFKMLLQYARSIHAEANHVVIGGNFNIRVQRVTEWLENKEFGSGFVIKAPRILLGNREGKQNIDYFLCLSKLSSIDTIDIHNWLGITTPGQHQELAHDLQHLLKLLSEMNLNESENENSEDACKKPHLPENLSNVFKDSTSTGDTKCKKQHLLEALSKANEPAIITSINILQTKSEPSAVSTSAVYTVADTAQHP
ncbi:uncharacterized protein [Antedon mediterranea]|uniref:uncharacterized protein n=1 Tax=Antedon mediterranea TaxID=105859 RepID=UPI003AF53F93